MKQCGPEIFRGYLQAIPDDLLEIVTEDYIWLAGQNLGSEFRRRRECCREECSRRGAPQLYRLAEELIAA